MSFDDIATGIRRVWEFIVPPTIRLIAILTLTYFVSPRLCTTIAQAVAHTVDPAILTDPRIRTTLEFYGITKIIPLASIVILLAFMNFVETLVLALGHLVPPYIVTSQPALFFATATPDRIKQLWRSHHLTDNAYELRSFLEVRFNRLDASERQSAVQWGTAAAKSYRIFTTLKFLTVWVLMVALIAIWSGRSGGGELVRAFLAVAGLLVASLYQIAKNLYARMQQEHSFISAVLTLPAEPATTSEGTEEVIDLGVKRALASGTRWWKVRIVNNDLIRWVWEHLLPNRLSERFTGRKLHKRGFDG